MYKLLVEDHNAPKAAAAKVSFYIPNSYNSYTRNAASGGFAGYSFPALPTPVGVSVGGGRWVRVRVEITSPRALPIHVGV